jgi:hypothetical protein
MTLRGLSVCVALGLHRLAVEKHSHAIPEDGGSMFPGNMLYDYTMLEPITP